MDKQRNIWIIAGETSGDIYGAMLYHELQAEAAKRGEKLKVTAMGGPRMAETGMDIMVDSTELGVVGVVEVLKIIFKILKIMRFILKKAEEDKPDAIILIDYAEFNLQMAKRLSRRGHKIIWYISPQVWSWRKGRIPQLARYCTKMMVIFPFEPEVYAGTGLDVEFVGHPLVEIVRQRRDQAIERDPKTVLLLPGSRSSEIKRLLAPMLDAAKELYRKHPELKFVLSTPRAKIFDLCSGIYNQFRSSNPDTPPLEITTGDTPYWQQRAGTGLAASGTVTVECAVNSLPLVVIYKTSFWTALMAWALVDLYRGFFTMVNVIADKEVFNEFFQYKVVPANLVPALEKVLPGGERRQEVEQEMTKVAAMITGGTEGASHRAAEICLDIASR